MQILLVVCIMCVCCVDFVFFFKQKTAYEMRISDWSSDVCSSDLKASLDTALATLADNVYGVVADETHDDRRYRYRVTDHAIVNGWLDEIGRASCRARVCQYV